MELPSMVVRSGGRLVVRSLVSGVTVYQTAMDTAGTSVRPTATHPLVGAELLERQLQILNRTMPTTSLLLPRAISTAYRNIKQPMAVQLHPDSKCDEDLPQCKIRRNYSCNNCSFFTQNPRSHLSHLRDVHGEKIVINECKLCLYASRHFQKLVRHMKMVHGCSDDDSNAAGRRHSNREARKRRLEESIEIPSTLGMLQGAPTLKQLKQELLLQEQLLMSHIEVYNRQQQLQTMQNMVSNSGNIFSMAFELQSRLMAPATAAATTTETVQRDVENSSSGSEEQPQLGDCLTTEALDLTPGKTITQYQCQKCSYSTSIRARFKKHVKYHSMPLIKCGSCDFHSPYKWNLDRHTKNHGADGYFKCSVCDFSTNIKQSLTIHELNHHVALRRPGAQDQQQADTTLEMTAEPASQSSPDPLQPTDNLNELPPISCSFCQQRMPNAMELVNHLQHCEPAMRNATQLACDISFEPEEDFRNDSAELSYCGVETAPGYGEVTEQLQPEDSDAMKKVFKCPHCTFWAATASRFHVHIVGHLNRKPFECSLCSYRSNWRWDITKHIRLKALRDKSHLVAHVLMNDETGRRNYAKYNQYLTLMKVSAEQAADAKTMRCGDMFTSDQTLPAGPQLEEEVSFEAQPGLDNSSKSSSALDLSLSSNLSSEQTD